MNYDTALSLKIRTILKRGITRHICFFFSVNTRKVLNYTGHAGVRRTLEASH